MRKLVTIREVSELRPIPDSDFIELAIVDGWQVVVKKGEFQVGDRGLYHEIDSFVPASDERYAFLSKDFREYEGNQGARLRSMRFRGQLSQGLMLPISSFPEVADKANGEDVTEIVGVIKWEPAMPAEMKGEARGLFPSYIPKTDAERVQNIPDVLEMNKGHRFEASIKLDGTSCTMFYGGPDHDKHFGICSRNYELRESDTHTMWVLARKYRLHEILSEFGEFAIQGEVIGEGIQGNVEKLKGQDFFVFNIYDIKAGRYMSPVDRMAVIDKINELYGVGLKSVPVLEQSIALDEKFTTIQDILDYADGPSLNPQAKREGVVFKRLDGGASFKSISNAFLLKHGDR
jgi:RNA ligase (TIGR02306 family)